MIANPLQESKVSITGTRSIIKDDKYPVNLNQIITFDIETVCNQDHKVLERFMPFIIKKVAKDININESSVVQEQVNNWLTNNGAFFPEINQIICISVGYINPGSTQFVLKSFVGENEKAILIQFNLFLDWFTSKLNKTVYLAGHNVKFFDIPQIYKKMLQYNIAPHSLLNVFGKKPWDIKVIDTFETYKAMGENLNSSLSSLAEFFSLEGKNDVAENVLEYYTNKEFGLIASYCENDVLIVKNYLEILSNLDQYVFTNI